MNFTTGFGSGGFSATGGPPTPGLSQPPFSREPTRPELIRVPNHVRDRMQRARVHLNQAVRAAEALGSRFDLLEQTVGPEEAVKALQEAESYLDRAKREFDKAESVVREMSGR